MLRLAQTQHELVTRETQHETELGSEINNQQREEPDAA
jgi:hypothetical protein